MLKPSDSSINHASQCVAIFVFDQMSLFEFGIAVELFSTNRLELENWYETVLVAEQPGCIGTADGVQIHPTGDLGALSRANMVLVPGWRVGDDLSPGVVSAFRDAYDRGAEFMSFCTGAFALASAGLLDNRRATTHWVYSDQFRLRFPKVELVDDVLFVNEERIATSAGSAAAIDLGLHIIRRDHGAGVANQVAQRLVASPTRNGLQRQYVERPVQDETNCIADSLDWAQRNLSNAQLTIEMMADVANLSRRSFDRNFRKVTGFTPNAWLVEQRLNWASELLEASNHTIERIASEAGFGSSATFRQNFNQRFGVSPSEYRKSRPQ